MKALLLLVLLLYVGSLAAQSTEPQAPESVAAPDVDTDEAPQAPVDEPASEPQSTLETDLADVLGQRLIGAEVVWLDDDQRRYLAVWRKSREAVTAGGVIIHGVRGKVVDRDPVYREIAETLASAGWSVLSLQPAPTDAEPEAVTDRLKAAQSYLLAEGLQNIAMIAGRDGCGSALPLAADGGPVKAYVGLGLLDCALNEIPAPILVVIGTRDPAGVRSQARRDVPGKPSSGLRESIVIEGAGPAFYGYESEVAKRIRGWLQRAAPGVQISAR